ncbi:Chromosome-partitioning protein Spo0J [Aliarcobacter thereius]|uniref:ParB/RepB/Spo0J family partition protein n=1 Tax=Aliarcobacter thereius TaxID=544718 RepID=UPI0008285F53|nr:ParB/RepB/Spo0J family partition protein [Aliarcobacter thereius]OCL85707.1 Chromosome-partitioning protein Spo0J [Aliarcobacter thereius]
MNLSKIADITAGKTKTSGISPFSELELSKVYPNQNQPRKAFEDIESLASTIKEHGLLQPITVVKKDGGYMIVSGERRYKAHLHNEAKTIKAYILNVADEKVEELTLIENIQRNDLTDFETAKHIVRLWESGRYDKKSDLAKKLGKSDSYISKAFSSLKLNDEILEDIEQNKKDIPLSVMDEISRLKDIEIQKEVYEKYSDGEITRDEIKEFKEPKSEIKNKIEAHNEKFIKDFSETLKDLVNKPITSNEDFPVGNLEATFKVDDLVQDKTEILEAKNFKENFPWGKNYNEELIDANKLENQFTQLIEEGYRSPHPKIKLNNSYEIMIYRLLLQKSSKEVDNKFNKINTWLNKDDGRIQDSSKGKLLLSDGCCTSLDNRYDEIIFDLLKENLELKKELHNIKENQTVQDNSILEDNVKELLTKGISIININKISNVFRTDDGKSIILNIKQSIKYFRNCKQKEFSISFIFESAKKIFIDEVLGKLDDYVLNEDEKILFNNKIEIIKIIEVCESSIYVEYDNSDSETISYSKAKELIKKTTQRSIPYTISAKTEKAYDFINKMPNRTQENSNLILKGK